MNNYKWSVPRSKANMLFLVFFCKCVSFLSPPSMCHMWNIND